MKGNRTNPAYMATVRMAGLFSTCLAVSARGWQGAGVREAAKGMEFRVTKVNKSQGSRTCSADCGPDDRRRGQRQKQEGR